MNSLLSLRDLVMNCLQVSRSWELLHKTQGVTSDFFSLSPPALLFTSSLTPVAKVPTSGVFCLLKPFCFFSCFFADVFSLWSYCYHRFAGNSWFSLKETVEYGEWRIPRFNVSGTRQCSFTVTLVFIPINPAVYFTTPILNIMRELASHPLTSWYTIKIIFWTEFKCNYKIFSCTQHFHVPGSHAWLLLYYITNFLPLFC